jgi:uncharacterized protein YjbI with pentapeptide repeats
MRYLLLPVLVISIVGVLMCPTASSQEVIVPNWIKNNAGWWASDQIPDSAFLQGIQYLIKEEIIIIHSTEASESPQSQEVPTWIKNTAGWWAEDKISEVEFVNAIEFLIKHRIITVNNGSSCASDLSEIFGGSIAMVQDICDFHELSQQSELLPFITEPNFNSHGFRGAEFSEIKPPNAYRIFMVGGSTMFGSGESSDDTTIPGLLQKIFDSDNSVTQQIEVINAGSGGGNTKSEFELLMDLNNFQPDLVIVYDGLNDLKADYPVKRITNYWKEMCDFSKENNFDIILSIQPIAGFGNKELTQQELVNSFQGQDHNGFQLIIAKSTYDYMWREMSSLQDYCNVIDLRGIFDNINGPIYWDQGHVSDTANLITAEKFHEVITELIFNEKPNKNKFHNVISKYNSPAITSYLLSKIGIDVEYTKIKKHDLSLKNKLDGNYFYLKNKLGGSDNILVGKDLSKTDLSKINLTEQDLSGANLSGQAGAIKDLRKVDFTGTILRSANLSFTNLSGQDLSGKDLTGVNFHSANLENVNLSDIITNRPIQFWIPPFSDCSFKSQLLVDYTLENLVGFHKCAEEVIQNEKIITDFSNTNLRGVIMNFSEYNYLHNIDFSGADLTGIELSHVGFRNCDFIGTKLNDSRINVPTFFYVNFINVEMKNSQFTGVPFFQNVSFHNAKIIDGYFEKPIFIDTDFSNAYLDNTLFDKPIMIGDNDLTCKNNQICH